MLLVLGLLGGGLVCLLVMNVTLAANSSKIINLQEHNTSKAALVQQLRQQVAGERSASVIEKEARKLGMRPDPRLNFVNLRNGKITVGTGPGSGANAGIGPGTRAAAGHGARTGTDPAAGPGVTTGPGR